MEVEIDPALNGEGIEEEAMVQDNGRPEPSRNGRGHAEAGGDEDEEDEEDGESTGEHKGLEDSSEEDEDDSEEERKLRKDFIEDDEDDGRKHKRRKHKHKHRHRRHKHRRDDGEDSDPGGDLDEDDLDLVAENTGVARKRPEKRRLLRAGSVASDDLDDDRRNRVAAIWGEDEDDDDAGAGPSYRRGDDYEDGLDDFIDDDDDEDRAAAARSQKAKGKAPAAPARQKQGARMMGGLAPAISGISNDAWEEVMETFGDGQDYDWAMNLDDDDEPMDADGEGYGDAAKAPVRLRDIFEPSELKERMLTDADEAIRALDVPERTQLLAAGLSVAATTEPLLEEDDIGNASAWMATRISTRCSEAFVLRDTAGFPPPLHDNFIQALESVIRFFAIDYLEVPFVWAHRRDYITLHRPSESQRMVHFLLRDDLWTVQNLTFRFRALLERKRGLARLFDKLSVPAEAKEIFEECFAQVESVDEVNDLMQWLRTHHGKDVMSAQENWKEDDDLEADLGDEAERELGVGKSKPVKYRKAGRDSRYERACASVIRELAGYIAISPHELAKNLVGGFKSQVSEDPDKYKMPLDFADTYANPASEWDVATKALDAAKLILSTQISKELLLKKNLREQFRQNGIVNVLPTEKGMTIIDETHPFYAFKYLANKPFGAFIQTAPAQFLQILCAEADLLVTCSVQLVPEAFDRLKKDLAEAYTSDDTSEVADAWNALRTSILDHALEHLLLPEAARWARNHLKEEAENWLARRCGDILEDRIEVAPFRPRNLEEGEVPSVVAISNGGGDARRDSTFAAYIDDQGRFRDHMVISDLRDEAASNELLEFLGKRKPDVIVVGGFTAHTYRLLNDIKAVALNLSEKVRSELAPEDARDAPDFPVITVRDDTARIYQLSKRAEAEFGTLTSIGKYCVALARYVQSPLNEYAALGKDLIAVSYMPDQSLLPTETLQAALDRSLVNVVNLVGVDVNKAVHDSYYQHLLPYVCGLGPRKAGKLVKAINAIDGTLRTREELVTQDVVTAKIFYNCASFLRILQDEAHADLSTRDTEPDVLDDTRIHPEDYHIARKMAADAMELDEEDLTDQHPSQVVSDLMETNAQKLNELSLDDFAEELERLLHAKKRFTLYQIREELQNPHCEKRARFVPLSPEQFFDLVTGESEATLAAGLLVPTKILRHRDREIVVRLDSGLEGTISKGYMVESGAPDMSKFPVGATIPAMVMNVYRDRFSVELNAQPSMIASAALSIPVKPDKFFDHPAAELDKSEAESKKKSRSSRHKRVIKHPNFHNFNSGQAEEFLSSQPRGECVIRPSSRGPDHLAVTWKVDEGVYQHIDVLELDKPTDFALGRSLRVGGKYNYSDLDELIFSHVRGMARKVEEMMLHEKYKGGPEELASFLSTSIMANPDRAVYGFAIDRESAGRFLLGFRTKQMSGMSIMNVRVLPTAFQLGETELADMLSLCNAFKLQQINRQLHGTDQTLAGNRSARGGRTPLAPPVSQSPAYGPRTPSRLNYGGGTPVGGYGHPGYGQQGGMYPAQPVPQAAYGAYPVPPQGAWMPQGGMPPPGMQPVAAGMPPMPPPGMPPPQNAGRAYGYR